MTMMTVGRRGLMPQISVALRLHLSALPAEPRVTVEVDQHSDLDCVDALNEMQVVTRQDTVAPSSRYGRLAFTALAPTPPPPQSNCLALGTSSPSYRSAPGKRRSRGCFALPQSLHRAHWA